MGLRGNWAVLCPSSVFSALGSISTELVSRSYIKKKKQSSNIKIMLTTIAFSVYKRNEDTHRHVVGGAIRREQLGVEILPFPLKTHWLHLQIQKIPNYYNSFWLYQVRLTALIPQCPIHTPYSGTNGVWLHSLTFYFCAIWISHSNEGARIKLNSPPVWSSSEGAGPDAPLRHWSHTPGALV